MHTREMKSKILYGPDDTKEIPAESIALKFHQVWFIWNAQRKAESVFPTTFRENEVWGNCLYFLLLISLFSY